MKLFVLNLYLLSYLFSQINQSNFNLHSAKSKGSVNLTQLIRDIEKKGELIVPEGIGNQGLKILAGTIRQKTTKVNEHLFTVHVYCTYL